MCHLLETLKEKLFFMDMPLVFVGVNVIRMIPLVFYKLKLHTHTHTGRTVIKLFCSVQAGLSDSCYRRVHINVHVKMCYFLYFMVT